MATLLNRRELIQLAAAGGTACLLCGRLPLFAAGAGTALISPGCRRSKVKIGRLYVGASGGQYGGLWPKPNLDLKKEIKFYEGEFKKIKDQISDVDFVVDELVSSPQQVEPLKEKLADVDGILVIHLTLGTSPIFNAIVDVGKPTMVFSAPYSGHEWSWFGQLRKEERGAKVEAILTSDYSQLAAAIRPFRAIHHLKEAKVCNLSTRDISGYAESMKEKFGTEIKLIELDRMLKIYESVDDSAAKAECDDWIKRAEKVVEPDEDEIFRSCKLALAFEKLLDEEDATVMAVDCYGSMYRKLPAFPCVGFTRLNDMGLGGICESDLQCGMTHIIMQGLCGKPGFISDPTVDESENAIILAHCLGTRKMDGPNGRMEPYKLRTIMERQEGAVPQVQMRIGQRVTQALLEGTDKILYFTGEIIDAPVALEDDRGCRTKITVRTDGCVEKLWKNWSAGLHRQTCYGDITKDLERFCRFMDIELIDESA
jgi:hypothetical protein